MRGRLPLAMLSVAVLAMGGIPTSALAEEPVVVGNASGAIDCRTYQYEKPDGSKGTTSKMPCDLRWGIDVVNGTEWSFDETRQFEGRAGNGISYSSTIRATGEYTMTLDPQGGLTKLVLAADLESTVTHAGDTTLELRLDIPFTAAAKQLRLQDTLLALADGEDNYVSRVEVSAALECAGEADEPATGGNRVLEQTGRDVRAIHQGEPTATLDLSTGTGACTLHVLAKVDARNSSVVKSDHAAHARAQVDLELGEAPCDLSGVVRDGDAVMDGHDNPMPGIPVRLLADGVPTGVAAVTGNDGRYCLRGVEDRDYVVRATLEDGDHDPPIFRTRHSSMAETPAQTIDVVADDLGRDDLDVVFSGDAARPWLAHVANIHWQEERFITWALDSLPVDAASLGTFEVVTFHDNLRSHYVPGEVHLSAASSTFEARDEPLDNGPDNAEWHETVHHFESVLKFAHLLRAPTSCIEPVYRHGGWQNASTCDSLNEGFAAFLPVIASVAIDETRGPGFANDSYASMFVAEDNGWRPWSRQGTQWREDFAVAQLLWDIVDRGVDAESIVSADRSRPNDLFVARVRDEISVPVRDLVAQFIGAKVETVVDVYDLLRASDVLGDAATKPSVDLNGDGAPDVTRLDAVFLMHGFHPYDEAEPGAYFLGDPIARTDRAAAGGGAMVRRNDEEEVAGSAIRLVNGAGAPVSYTIKVDYPDLSREFAVEVDANTDRVVHLELPPYARGSIDPDALPACDADHDREVTVTVSGGGLAPLTLTNCEFWHAVTVATGDAAITYGDAAPPASGAPAAPIVGETGDPIVMVLIGAAALAVVVFAVAFVVGSRRGRAAPGA